MRVQAEVTDLNRRRSDISNVTNWTYKGVRLPPAPDSISLVNTNEEVTSYFLAKVLATKFNDVRCIIATGAPSMVIHCFTVLYIFVDAYTNMITVCPASDPAKVPG